MNRRNRLNDHEFIERFWTYGYKINGHLIWTHYVNKDGYGQLMVDAVQDYAHRVAWRIANGPIPSGSLVLHSCDIPACINPKHLFLGSNRDNAADSYAKNRRRPKIPSNARTKIQALMNQGKSQKEIASMYGASPSAVSKFLHIERKIAHG